MEIKINRKELIKTKGQGLVKAIKPFTLDKKTEEIISKVVIKVEQTRGLNER